MCGILAVLGYSDDSLAKRAKILQLSRRLKHRAQTGVAFISMGITIYPTNGWRSLTLLPATNLFTTRTSRLLSPEDFVDMLDGVFSFVLLNTRDNSFFVARDAVGVTSLYIGWGIDGTPTARSVWISSEMKGLNDNCEHFQIFPPGNLYSSKTGGFRRWYNPSWFSEMVPCANYEPMILRKALEDAVIKRLMTNVPFGVLLSGGLDSSLVAVVICRHLERTKAVKLHSFCVGLEGSPDLKAAKEVAEYLGTVHYKFYFTVQDGIDAIEDVI
ncbi:hypothetical protein ZOSMA_72G00340 [Zostera marina]|uniref:Glutamine amidotransferase type-2 domain-containing protein n=1 Tax=Zostera marina TaxID=29655 RepID=A0A0K9NS21_ZOSMR|nr:hypothetical protein ZOSMA_72G00340 [Zostera marina]